MSMELWLAVAATTVGTLLMRMLPLIWMRKRLSRSSAEAGVDTLPQWLSVLGPLMIAAVLGVSLAPSQNTLAGWTATLLGVLATLITWRRTRSLGWPVAVGVAAYGATLLLSGL
ncbi:MULTISPECIES: AzlD domain-containing protein [Halomonas]|uniref:AzlD domain-containing protein n=1 Tax=Halomonas TaxID=2745 RepID=UPI001A9086EC|nr:MULTISPECIES: AzlD domain-containing protein [Halomonas]MBN8413648.1 AzlD domain-containing protein [Halomonas litopenaei]MBY5969176.1 AzlD domain-containing protein [Halomonas denitrificans]MBY6030901.1 AzlD domain-containing protein [Halomonas sp. DP8Y7-1]